MSLLTYIFFLNKYQDYKYIKKFKNMNVHVFLMKKYDLKKND